MPMLFAWLEENAITRANELNGFASALGEADALRDKDCLTVGMHVPGRPGAGREVDTARAQARAPRGGRDRVDEYGAGEPLARTIRGFEAAPRHLHVSPPVAPVESPSLKS